MTDPNTDPMRNLQRDKKKFLSKVFAETSMPAKTSAADFSPEDLDALFDDVTVPIRPVENQRYQQAELPLGDEKEPAEYEILEQMIAALPPTGPAMNGHRGVDPCSSQTLKELFGALLTANDNEAIMCCLAVNSRISVETLYELLYDSLQRKLLALTGPDRVDDAIQDAFRKFIATLFKPNGWKANGSVEGWILRVAQNFHKETQRDRTMPFTDFARPNNDGDEGDSAVLFDERIGFESSDTVSLQGQSSSLESLLSLDELIDFKRALATALPKFSNDQRLVLNLIMEGYDIADIANLTRLSPYRVGQLWREITAMLRSAFLGKPVADPPDDEEGEPDSDGGEDAVDDADGDGDGDEDDGEV